MFCHVVAGEGLYDAVDPWTKPREDLLIKVSLPLYLHVELFHSCLKRNCQTVAEEGLYGPVYPWSQPQRDLLINISLSLLKVSCIAVSVLIAICLHNLMDDICHVAVETAL